MAVYFTVQSPRDPIFTSLDHLSEFDLCLGSIPETPDDAFLLPLVHDPCICTWFIHTCELPQEPASETVWIQPEIAHKDIIVLETDQLRISYLRTFKLVVGGTALRNILTWMASTSRPEPVSDPSTTSSDMALSIAI